MQRGVHTTFEALLAHPDELVVRYASGALKNMSATLQSASVLATSRAHFAVSDRSHDANVEEFRYRRAARTIVRAIGKLSADVRLNRLLRAKERGRRDVGGAPPAVHQVS